MGCEHNYVRVGAIGPVLYAECECGECIVCDRDGCVTGVQLSILAPVVAGQLHLFEAGAS